MRTDCKGCQTSQQMFISLRSQYQSILANYNTLKRKNQQMYYIQQAYLKENQNLRKSKMQLGIQIQRLNGLLHSKENYQLGENKKDMSKIRVDMEETQLERIKIDQLNRAIDIKNRDLNSLKQQLGVKISEIDGLHQECDFLRKQIKQLNQPKPILRQVQFVEPQITSDINKIQFQVNNQSSLSTGLKMAATKHYRLGDEYLNNYPINGQPLTIKESQNQKGNLLRCGTAKDLHKVQLNPIERNINKLQYENNLLRNELLTRI